jgi:hypothetical protein
VKLKLLKMKKSMFTAFALGLCLTANLMAQVPSYVPTNGLVGWWPFNGNANDESGNGNNGTVNGATLTTDRFGIANKAYSFDGVDDFIQTTANFTLGASAKSFSVWFKSTQFKYGWVISGGGEINNQSFGLFYELNQTTQIYHDLTFQDNNTNHNYGNVTNTGQWNNMIITYDGNNLKGFLNGIQIGSSNRTLNTVTGNIKFGERQSLNLFNSRFNGVIDDISIYNRALNECEIHDLYNSQINSVAGSISVSPQPATIGSSVLLSTASQTQNVQWQSNPSNFDWQNVPNNANYSGGTTNTLTVSNVQLSNHNQPFRIIASAGNCTDTSNVASILIADTCITNVTIYDTLYTTVTDTLIINTTLSLPAPNNENTILIYPNPASDHITIDNGNFAAMAGFTIKIENNAGQQVFQSLINQAQFYVDLSTWTGNGLYFVHLIDPQNNTVTVRKIVLQ